jgi:hypothetical protein
VPHADCGLGARECPVRHPLSSLHTTACPSVGRSKQRCLALTCVPPPPCVQKADGQLAFRGLVATPDGKKSYETSRTGGLTGTRRPAPSLMLTMCAFAWWPTPIALCLITPQVCDLLQRRMPRPLGATQASS